MGTMWISGRDVRIDPKKIEIEKGKCSCSKSNVLIQNPNTKDPFDEVGRLPSAVGQTTAINPTAVPTATAAASEKGGGLSPGAKAGNRVGVGIGGLLIIAAAILLFLMPCRRKKRWHGDFGNEKFELQGSGSQSEKSELVGDHYRGASVDTHESALSPDGQVLELEDANGVDRRSTGLYEMRVNTPHSGR